jgi:carbon monoxide dehydrogenase subunit G
MKIDQEFGVEVPVERVWRTLTDLEGLAPCLPGAQLTGVEGDTYKGRVKVKVGPVVSQFAGTARFVKLDEDARIAVISAAGKDTRGAGNASATIHARLRPEGAGTVVTVSTDLNISGRLAQFGSGMINEISQKLFAQFVENVETRLLAPQPAAVPEPEGATRAVAEAGGAPQAVAEPLPSAAPSVAPPPQREKASQREEAPADEPLDLMRLAGRSVYRRLVPALVVVVLVVAAVVLLLTL